jgi:hypothetical protein
MKLKVTAKAKIFCHGYFTPGVHTQPIWYARLEVSSWVNFDDETVSDYLTLIVPEDRNIITLMTEGHDSPEEAIEFLKKKVGNLEDIEIEIKMENT